MTRAFRLSPRHREKLCPIFAAASVAANSAACDHETNALCEEIRVLHMYDAALDSKPREHRPGVERSIDDADRQPRGVG